MTPLAMAEDVSAGNWFCFGLTLGAVLLLMLAAGDR
jgi:hypothetical protein